MVSQKLNMLHGNVKILAKFFILQPFNYYYHEIKVQTWTFMSHTRFNYFVVQIED